VDPATGRQKAHAPRVGIRSASFSEILKPAAVPTTRTPVGANVGRTSAAVTEFCFKLFRSTAQRFVPAEMSTVSHVQGNHTALGHGSKTLIVSLFDDPGQANFGAFRAAKWSLPRVSHARFLGKALPCFFLDDRFRAQKTPSM
jgi:hypothetical protein